MRSGRSDSLFIGALIVLAASSVGLKAAAGPPHDGMNDARPGLVEGQLVAALEAQGFSTSVRPLRFQSAIVSAEKGNCRLTVRDARGGSEIGPIFSRAARAIGPVRYLYRGDASAAPPALQLRIHRLETMLLNSVGSQRSVSVPIALATTQGCGGSNFGLSDVQIPA